MANLLKNCFPRETGVVCIGAVNDLHLPRPEAAEQFFLKVMNICRPASLRSAKSLGTQRSKPAKTRPPCQFQPHGGAYEPPNRG